MRSWKHPVVLLLWFLCALGLSAPGDITLSSDDREQPKSISLEERQRVEYEETGFRIALSISLSGRIVSVFGRDMKAWHFFQYSEAEDTWRGPYTWDVDSVELGNFRMTWALMPDGSDVLWENRPPHRTFRLVDGAIRQMQEAVETILPTLESETGRLPHGRRHTIADLVSLPSFEWGQVLLKEEQEAQGRTSQSVRADTMVLDVAPDHEALLCLYDDMARGGPLRSVEAGGKTVEYWPANGRPRDFDQGASGQYSPDGRFVMVNFNYDDDGHMFWFYDSDGRQRGMPGTVQIFTREGEFQAEVFAHAYRDDRPTRYAQAYWLRDNWIVYTSPYELVFVKVLYN